MIQLLALFIAIFLTATAYAPFQDDRSAPEPAAVNPAATDRPLKEFETELGKFNASRAKDALDDKLSNLQRWVRAQVDTIVPKDSALSGLTLKPELLKLIQDKLKEQHQGEKNYKVSDKPTLEQIAGILANLDPAHLKELAAILVFENQKKHDERQKPKPTDEETLRNALRRQVEIFGRDSESAPLELGAEIKAKLMKAYLESEPGKKLTDEQKTELRRKGLSTKQVADLLKDLPPNTFTQAEWLNSLSGLGLKNFEKNGTEYHWSQGANVYGNFTHANPNAPKFEEIRRNFEKQSEAPGKSPSPDTANRFPETRPIGQGPKVGSTPKGGSGSGGSRDSGMKGEGKSAQGVNEPTEKAKLSAEQIACLEHDRKSVRRSSDFVTTYEGDPGQFHCGLTFIAKDPEKLKSSEQKKNRCKRSAITAKHCVNYGKMASLSIEGVSQIFGYALQVQSAGEPISGGDDAALLTVEIPCAEVQALPLTRVISPEEYDKLRGPIPLLLGRNGINESKSSPNNGAILAQGIKENVNKDFIGFNSDFADTQLNHGSSTQQGDSGSGVITCAENSKGKPEGIWLGAVSFVYRFPGFHGGAASGTTITWLNKILPTNASDTEPDPGAVAGLRDLIPHREPAKGEQKTNREENGELAH